MATPLEVQAALRYKGFEILGTVCVGRYQGYALRLSPGLRGRFTMEIAVRLDRKDKSIAASLAGVFKRSGPRRIVGVVNRGLLLALTLRFDRQTPIERQIDEVFEQAVSALRERGIAPAATCVVCGGARPDSLACFRGYQPVHAGCVKRLALKTETEAEENRLNGSYLTGLLGAVLGMLVGMIPNLLTMIFQSTIFSLLFALIPFASMLGYRLLNGKRTRASLVIVIVLSLASVLLMQATYTAASIAREYAVGFGEALSAILPYAFSAEGFPYLLRGSALSLLYMALSIVLSWWFLSRTNVGDVRGAKAVVASLRPNPDYAAAGTSGGDETTSSDGI